jgi:hypothetical protein
MTKEQKKSKKCGKDTVCDWSETPTINTDPFGSYTGINTEDKYEIPVQDADDL